MEKPAKIALVSLSLLLFLGCCCCGGFFLYAVGNAEDWEASDAAAQREGIAHGRTSTSEGCIDEALRRFGPCSKFDVGCTSSAELFTTSCLSVVRDPSDALCAGVPAPSLFSAESVDAGERFCVARGHDPASACDDIFLALSEHCRAVSAGPAPGTPVDARAPGAPEPVAPSAPEGRAPDAPGPLVPVPVE